MNDLPLLRDIHLPPAEWIFPLGIGWLYIGLAVLCGFVLYRVLRYFYQKSRKRFAFRLLDSYASDTISAAAGVSELLRRICLAKYKEASTLYGSKWIDFLNSRSSEKIKGPVVELLLNAPYMPETTMYRPEVYRELRRFVKKWIGENL